MYCEVIIHSVFDMIYITEEVLDIDITIELFDVFYKRKINECVEAYKFNIICEQKAGETFGENLSVMRK